MADYVLLGLVVAVVIVGVLLLSCWKAKPNGKKYKKRGGVTYDVVEGSGMAEILQSGGTTGFGTAQLNREYNNRANRIADSLKAYDGYQDVIKYQGLEKGVFQSHNQYIRDMNHTTSTASMQTERDDLGDMPVTWVGLQRPNYTDNPGIEASARQDASFTQDQMPKYRHFIL